MAGRSDLLNFLLQQDDLISEDVVAAACERKDRESVRLLLDSGWPIDKPVQTAASLLW